MNAAYKLGLVVERLDGHVEKNLPIDVDTAAAIACALHDIAQDVKQMEAMSFTQNVTDRLLAIQREMAAQR